MDTKCPGCSGAGRVTSDPAILRCAACGGVFSAWPIIPETVIAHVRYDLPMLANAGLDGVFYFDFDVTKPSMVGSPSRMHGWADRATKRVVQWG